MAKGYTDKTKVENYLTQEIAADFADQLTDWIEAVENYIDHQTGRDFKTSNTETIRKYDGNGCMEMVFDEFVSLKTLTISDTEVSSSDYYLYPANKTPKRRIVLTSGVFSRGNQNIELEAKFGYSTAVPEDIVLAATVLVAAICTSTMADEGEVQSMTIGRYSVTYSSGSTTEADVIKAMDIIKGYKLFTF